MSISKSPTKSRAQQVLHLLQTSAKLKEMFTPLFFQKALDLNSPPSFSANRISTDSRSIRPGDLFVAIPGEQFDGHDFISEAAKKGAHGALVSTLEFKGRAQLPTNFSLVMVDDTVIAIRKLAKFYRQTLKIPVFAVAGSNGKTTTKEWMSFLLEKIHGKENVFKTLKSQNSILGIALSLLQIRDEKYAVIEIGIDEPGWMEQHLEVVAPTHGLITTIAEEHLNRLKSIERVAEEELKLLAHLRNHGGSFAANLDSTWISSQSLPASCLTYGLQTSADLEGVFRSPNILRAFGLDWQNPLPGRHNAQNLLAALTALRLLNPHIDLSALEKLSEKCMEFQGEAHRSRWIEMKNEIRVLDDCYNANPDSMQKAFQSFVELTDGCSQKVVLADMLDLGEASAESHRRILNLAVVFGFHQIYLYGGEFKKAYSEAGPAVNVQIFEEIDVLKESLKRDLRPRDTLLLKGSRSMRLERLLEIFS